MDSTSMAYYFQSLLQIPVNMMDNEIMVVDPDDERMDDGSSDDVADLLNLGSLNDVEDAPISVAVNYLDLDKLSKEFTVTNLLYRLLHMLEVCPNQKEYIASYIVKKFDLTNLDIEFCRKFYALTKFDSRLPQIPDEFFTSAEVQGNAVIESAVSEMKKWQDSGVKESIRTAMVGLFDAYFRTGKFSEATKLYGRSMRDFITSPRAVIPMLLDQIKALFMMKDYSRADVFLSQAERAIIDCQQRESQANVEVNRGPTSLYPRDDKVQKAAMKLSSSAQAKITATWGVVKMLQKQYKFAAERFVDVNHELYEFPELFAPVDIAYYGCFCALATFDRQELFDKVLNNGNFRKFMEPEGKLVDLIQAFRNNSFVTVFELLEELRPVLLLNIYIAKQVENIYRFIRRRAFVQYTATFGVIDLMTMCKVFRTSTTDLVNELVDLIDNDMLAARVDPISMKLYKPKENKPNEQSERIVSLQKNMDHRVTAILIRACLSLNGVNVSREQAEDDPVFPPGAKKGRRMGPHYEYDDFEEENFPDDNSGILSQTQQLSFENSNRGNRSIMQRLMQTITHRAPGSSGGGQRLGSILAPLNMRNEMEGGYPDDDLDQTQSDVDMADP